MPNTNPTADPVDYPPAVLKEAEDASRHAFEKAQQVTALEPERRRSYAAAQAANAYAAALARHTVAVRMAAAEQAATDRERPAACGLCDVGAHDPRIHVLRPADATVEQVRPEQAEIARLTAEREALKTKLHEADEEIDSERERVVMLEEERDALAKRVEALRGALAAIRSDMSPGCSHVSAANAQRALAADDKAAQS